MQRNTRGSSRTQAEVEEEVEHTDRIIDKDVLEVLASPDFASASSSSNSEAPGVPSKKRSISSIIDEQVEDVIENDSDSEEEVDEEEVDELNGFDVDGIVVAEIDDVVAGHNQPDRVYRSGPSKGQPIPEDGQTCGRDTFISQEE